MAATVFCVLFLVGATAASFAQETGDATERLFDAIQNKDLTAARSSIAEGADIEAPNALGLTPIDVAVDRGYFDIAHYLISVRNRRAERSRNPESRDIHPGVVSAVPTIGVMREKTPPPSPAEPPVTPTEVPPATGTEPSPFDPQSVAPGTLFPEVTDPANRPKVDLPPVPTAPLGEEVPLVPPSEAVEKKAEASSAMPAHAATPAAAVTQNQETGKAETPPAGKTALLPGIPAEAPAFTVATTATASETPSGTSEPLPAVTSLEAKPAPPPTPRQRPTPPTRPTLAAKTAPSATPSQAVEKMPPEPSASLDIADTTSEMVENPFAPEAIAPGTTHPAVGKEPAVMPPPPASQPPLVAETSTPPVEIATSIDNDGTGDHETAPQNVAANDDGEEDEQTAAAGATPGFLKPLTMPPPLTKPKTGAPPTVTRKWDETLTIGRSLHLDAALPVNTGTLPGDGPRCIERKRGTVRFCVLPTEWPDELKPEIRVSTVMYQGTHAIARIEDGHATRYHVIFPNESFEALVAHYSRRFGPPTAREEREIAPFGKPRQKNPAVMWKRVDTYTGQPATLEIRKYDDTQGGFPSMRYGALMLYDTKSAPIFPEVSILDLMPTTARGLR